MSLGVRGIRSGTAVAESGLRAHGPETLRQESRLGEQEEHGDPLALDLLNHKRRKLGGSGGSRDKAICEATARLGEVDL